MITVDVAFYMHDLSGGGVERMRLALIAALRARGLNVTLVLGARQGALLPLLPPDLPVMELGSQRTLRASLKLAAFLRAARPDLLVASLDHNNIAALLAGWIAGPGTAVVICQHNALSAERARGWRYRVVPWLYWLLQARARGIVAVSLGVAADLAAVAGIARARITPIYNPVIGPDFAARSTLRAAHPWLNDPACKVFIFAGRLTAQKNPALALDALVLVRRHHPARLIMLGEGELLPALRAQADRLGIADCVDFLGFQANPLPWIAACDALLCTSHYEGLGNVIIEALGCGTPVIATDCPYGPAEILGGGLFGQLVPPDDAPALAAAMQAQLGLAPDRARLRQRAAHFSVGACAEAHLALFDDILSVTRAPCAALGMRLDPWRADQVVARLLAAPPPGDLGLVVTPNIEHVRLLRRPDFAAAYSSATLICPDGFPVLLYARWRGLALAGRVTGCALFHELAHHPHLAGQTLFLVLESQVTADAVMSWAGTLPHVPRLRIAVAPPNLAGDAAAQRHLAQEIHLAAPDILVLTLGAPVSEIFAHQYRVMLPRCWVLCVGQAVRVELGLVRRAPRGWRRLGLEWLWRLRQEPGRLWRRYLGAMVWFPVAMLRDSQARKKGVLF